MVVATVPSNMGRIRKKGVVGAICRAGTSRVFVFRGAQSSEGERERIVRMVMAGDLCQSGLSEAHYQRNKFAFLWPGQSTHTFEFQFYQYDAADNSVLTNMECASSGVSCAAYAVSAGLASLGPDGVVAGFNRGTHQQALFVPEDPRTPHDTPWKIVFDQSRLTSSSIIERRSECPAYANLFVRALNYGNGFVFVPWRPGGVDRSLVESMAERGGRMLKEGGGIRRNASEPKLIFFEQKDSTPAQTVLDVCCYYRGAKHRSIPASAAIALACVHTLERLEEANPDEARGSFAYLMRHPEGDMQSSVFWERSGPIYIIRSAQVVSRVSIVMAGNLLLGHAAAETCRASQ